MMANVGGVWKGEGGEGVPPPHEAVSIRLRFSNFLLLTSAYATNPDHDKPSGTLGLAICRKR